MFCKCTPTTESETNFLFYQVNQYERRVEVFSLATTCSSGKGFVHVTHIFNSEGYAPTPILCASWPSCSAVIPISGYPLPIFQHLQGALGSSRSGRVQLAAYGLELCSPGGPHLETVAYLQQYLTPLSAELVALSSS
jgi:hypothetical protein